MHNIAPNGENPHVSGNRRSRERDYLRPQGSEQSFRPIVTNKEWHEILGDIIEVFHLVEGGFLTN
jgi:hypothetical protein